MSFSPASNKLAKRNSALELSPEEFREIGHRLVDQLATLLGDLPSRRVTPGETAAEVREALGTSRNLPHFGSDPASAVEEATRLVADHSLFNGHPRFFGYITSSAAPIGAFGDFIAAVVNANAGAWKLAPAATEIELQTIRWIAEFIGYPAECAGLLVSGGNMANLVCFLTARTAKLGQDLRKSGIRGHARQPRCYCSAETHTWIQKAADLSGLGTDCIRWIAVDRERRMDVTQLRKQVERDLEAGEQPFLVVGTAGSVSTGAVDPLPEIMEFCRERGLWFHVDGAYGGVAAKVPGAPADLAGISSADSIAIDPHKWLYAPLEAGCVLVQNKADLLNTFSYHPPYYNFDGDAVNFFDLGPQNSRGFRTLKVWLGFQQAGRSGYVESIATDMALAEEAFRVFGDHPDLEAVSCNLSICTFRYVPRELRAASESPGTQRLLNALNYELLTRIEKSGEAFLSTATIADKYLLRICIVNFRTSYGDIERLPGFIAQLGRTTYADMQARGGFESAGSAGTH